MTTIQLKSTELLAPAGDFAALRAAIGNGADAVYLGAGTFNARRNAPNFSAQELVEAIDFAHLRSVKVYLALNTLIADDEGDAAIELAALAYENGIDAVIVQDVGLAAVLHRILPDLPLHASTQMTIHDRAGLEAAARLGISRVILPRELSLAEIAEMTALARSLDLTTEVFVHGAVCMSYSGQCLLSSMIGGRSGNRGECAQPCRLPWQRSFAGSQATEPQGSFPWLSPRDQALIDYLPGLIDAGVASFKIEGRMRGSAYVGQVTSIYRSALDRAAAWTEDAGSTWRDQTAGDKRRLLFAFNRGGEFTDRYISGRRLPDYLSGTHTGSHGVLLGAICGLEPRFGLMRVMTASDWPAGTSPGRGDVLSVRRPETAQETASAPIGSITAQGRKLTIKGFHPDILAELREGDPVFLMNDRQAEQTALKADKRHTKISITCSGEGGQITLAARVMPGQGAASGLAVSISCRSEAVNPLDPARAEQQLKKTGGTPFDADEIHLSGPVCLTISSLNELRRQLISELDTQLVRSYKRQLPVGFSANWTQAVRMLPRRDHNADALGSQVALTACYARIPSFSEIACGAARYLLPLLGLSEQNAPAIVQAIHAVEPDAQIMAWLPAASSGSGAELVSQLLRQLPAWGFDGIYAGHLGLDQLTDPKLEKCVDLGANLFNQATAAYFAGLGVTTICASPELDLGRLIALRKTAREAGLCLELPIYGRLRLMTSEFCPLGQNLPGCHSCHEKPLTGEKPDASAVLNLKDRKDQSFPVILHPRTCTSEIYSHFLLAATAELVRLASETQADGSLFDRLTARLIFVNETLSERRRLTGLCQQLLTAAGTDNRQILADFQSAARQAAERQNSPLSHGHYHQGV